jgi:hypothetical protein
MNCADVCIDHDADHDNEFYVESIVIAKKQHKCCECGYTIHAGQRYQRVSGKSYGHIWTAKTCAICYGIRRAFVCGSWTFGLLWESIEESMFPIWETRGPIDCLAKLESVEERDMCRDRYRDWKEGR